MRLVLAALAALPVLALAACAGPVEESPRAAGGGSVSPPITSGGDGTMRIARAPVEALAFVERVAAACLLDGVVGGAAMIVDRPGRRVLIVGDDAELLSIAVAPGSRGSSVRLSGPAAVDRGMRREILHHLDRAARTGDPACPALPA